MNSSYLAVSKTGPAFGAVLLVCFGAIARPDFAAADQPAGAVDAEGLVRVPVEGIEQVYARPNANLSTYTKIFLDPIDVSFRKDWNPAPAGQPISASEKQEIRNGLARVLREEFVAELARTGRYTVVNSPTDGVLRIKADIRDLYINAPDVPRPGIIRTYTVSVGEMRLVAELRDAPTGDLIARVVDQRRDPESPWFELTTRVSNVAAARRAAAHWAGIMREQLDAAHRVKGQP